MAKRKAKKTKPKITKKDEEPPKIAGKHQTTIKLLEPPKFPFMKLPFEIRQMILAEALPNRTEAEECFECGTLHDFPPCGMADFEDDDSSVNGHSHVASNDPAIVVNYIGVVPEEPAFLRLAEEHNKALYSEALPFYYSKSNFHLECFNMDMTALSRYFKSLDDQYHRSQLLRKMSIHFTSATGYWEPAGWLEAKEQHLHAGCSITLTGNQDLLWAFIHLCRAGDRMRRRGLDWDVIRSILQDVENAGDYLNGEERDWAEAGYEESFFVHDYAELVLEHISNH